MTLDDYARLLAESHDEPAFSNSTEGEAWTQAHCSSCIHDAPARSGDDARGCPLVLITLMGRRPRQFRDGPRGKDGAYSLADQYVCTEYRHEDDGPIDPQPLPVPDGQGELVPRAPFEGNRALAPLDPALSPAASTDTAPTPAGSHRQ